MLVARALDVIGTKDRFEIRKDGGDSQLGVPFLIAGGNQRECSSLQRPAPTVRIPAYGSRERGGKNLTGF